jgi:hypothetical protein
LEQGPQEDCGLLLPVVKLLDNYNFEMNDKDVANQLCLFYWIMRFQHSVKWWWSLFLWGYEVSLINADVSYKRYYELKGVAVQWTHNYWNDAIGYAHVDPDEYWPQRKLPPKSNPKVGNAEKRVPRMDTLALSPTWGRLRDRLSSTTHMSVMATVRIVCQLHQ